MQMLFFLALLPLAVGMEPAPTPRVLLHCPENASRPARSNNGLVWHEFKLTPGVI